MNARNQCELRTKRTDKLFEEKRVNMRELDLSIQQVLERRHRNGEDKLPPGETAETKKTKNHGGDQTKRRIQNSENPSCENTAC